MKLQKFLLITALLFFAIMTLILLTNKASTFFVPKKQPAEQTITNESPQSFKKSEPSKNIGLYSRNDSSKVQIFTDLKSYNTVNYSFKYPSQLAVLDNPRNLEYFLESQSLLFNQTVANEYLECLEIGKKQSLQYQKDHNANIAWVDWEGGCDFDRVVLYISASKKKYPSNLNFIMPSKDEFIEYKTFLDNQNRTWEIVRDWGQGTIAIKAYIEQNNEIWQIQISTDTRSLSKFLDVENRDYTTFANTDKWENHQDLLDVTVQILENFEFN